MIIGSLNFSNLNCILEDSCFLSGNKFWRGLLAEYNDFKENSTAEELIIIIMVKYLTNGWSGKVGHSEQASFYLCEFVFIFYFCVIYEKQNNDISTHYKNVFCLRFLHPISRQTKVVLFATNDTNTIYYAYFVIP